MNIFIKKIIPTFQILGKKNQQLHLLKIVECVFFIVFNVIAQNQTSVKHKILIQLA